MSKDNSLFSKINPSPEELQERINRCIEIYNYDRDKLSDDQVAKLRAFLSCDLYNFVSDIYKVSLSDEAYCQIEFDKVEAACFLKYFETKKSEGISASAAESLARKLTKIDPEYLDSLKNLKDAELISEINANIMKTATQVLHSMSYKSN